MRHTNSAVSARQAALCRRYAEDPLQAVTLKRVRTAQTTATDALHGTALAPDFPGSAWHYGIDAKVGGLDDLPNPGHLLCAALAACMDSTVRILAAHLDVPIAHLEVDVSGEVDVRGCLAVDTRVRPGFRGMRCEVRIQTPPDVDEKLVHAILRQARRSCVTLDTLRNGVPVEVSTRLSPRTTPAPTV